MAERVVLHVGLMKSGTSYLQRLALGNRDELSRRGLLFPGRTWNAQVQGVAKVLERKRVVATPSEDAWQGLVDELAAWDRTGLISMEYLAPAMPPKIDGVVSSFPAGTVDVVVTARDLGRSVPAMWQETLKNGRFATFDEYVHAIAEREGLGRGFWREQNLAVICRRWAKAVGTDHVVLVTVPPPGAPRDALWSRFATAIGVDPDGMTMPAPANESLGAGSAEVLRLLNEALDGMDFADYAPRVKHRLAKGVMGARRDAEPAIGFEPPAWLRKRAASMLAEVRSLGVRVVGDLDDLEPIAVPGIAPGEVSTQEQLVAAVAALEDIVRDPPRRRKGR